MPPQFPFAGSADWSLAKYLMTSGLSKGKIDEYLKTEWTKQHTPSFNTADELYNRIESLPGGPSWKAVEITLPEAPNEPQTLYYRDPVECLQFLAGNPALRGHMTFEAYETFTDAGMKEQVYSEIMTGRICAELQRLLPPGVTLHPAIFGSDATHTTNFSGDGKMHPIYISSGLIDAVIRNQPLRRAYMLVAYVPVCKFAKTEFPTAQQRTSMPGRLQARLFHKCLSIVFITLKSAGRVPISGTDCYGQKRLEMIIPVLYIADKEEQNLVVCLGKNCCPQCDATYDNLGDNTCPHCRTGQSILDKIRSIRTAHPHADTWEFIQRSLEVGLSGVEHPFWEDMPHLDICRIMSNDVLHGLHKAFKDHTFTWVTNMVGK
ncbi:hypothetical protein EXIGLDRAFT_618514, partial [Exidia glandulosa HHB12029]